MDPITLGVMAAQLAGNFFSGQPSIRADFEQSPQGISARRNRLVWWTTAGSILAAGSIITLFGWLVFRWSPGSIVVSIGTTLILAACVAVLGNILYKSALAAFTPQAVLDAERKREEEQERLTRDTTLPALLRYNRDQMALYHQIATTQARVAGRNSQTAMAIGFVALIAGSAVAIVSDDVTTKLITGSLAALGGIFSGYIARTFLVAQDKAIVQLYKYWEQPLTTSYILAAERLVQTFDNGRSKEKEFGKLINQLLMIAIQREAPSTESRNGSPLPRPRSKRARSDQKESGEGSPQSSEPEEYS